MIHPIQHKMMGLVMVSKSFLVDCGELVLIDTGHSRGCLGNVVRAVRGLGREPQEIALCVLTHRHRDHVGGLRAIKEPSSSTPSTSAMEQTFSQGGRGGLRNCCVTSNTPSDRLCYCPYRTKSESVLGLRKTHSKH